jgi:hypothetical protein
MAEQTKNPTVSDIESASTEQLQQFCFTLLNANDELLAELKANKNER